ncbi:hypothetical protein F4678DRAFT_166390 [Xylaria arbuscula]|nr:hypothetical protein F4678DRAFT_166390 [Xylaria arbuscula]
MNSSEFKEFEQRWNKRLELMLEQHSQERQAVEQKAHVQRQNAQDHARSQRKGLRRTNIGSADLVTQIRKIDQECDAIIETIDQQLSRRIRDIDKAQRIEKEDYWKGYGNALDARPFLDADIDMVDSLTVNSPAIHATAAPTTSSTTDMTSSCTTIATSGDTTAPARIQIQTQSQSQSQPSQSSGPCPDRSPPAEDAIPASAVSREQHRPTTAEKAFTVTVQREFADGKEQFIMRYKTKNRKALQEATKSKAKRPLGIDTAAPLLSPVSPDPTAPYEPSAPKTITFHEVYQNGQAKHKDVIVQYPPDSCHWYILKCEEHGLRFKREPLRGAAKHLDSKFHGHQRRRWDIAIRMFGYQVIDCNRELAALNNEAVDLAYAAGYKPISIKNPESRKRRGRRKRTTEVAGHAAQEASVLSNPKTDTATISQQKSTSPHMNNRNTSPTSSFQETRKTHHDAGNKIITNPKTFHVYYSLWNHDRRIYPVMILGWDDLKPSGLEHNLAKTGLLNAKNLPNCYLYKNIDSATNASITGWSPGFEDGGPMVKQRKFPVMFFDEGGNSGWVSAKSLSKFPLYGPVPSTEYDHPFNAARRWIAKEKGGFPSWGEFEAAQKKNARETRSGSVTTPLVSPITDVEDDFHNDSETNGDAQSSVSDATQQELLAMQETAGEIEGDSDYSGSSDMDSTLGDEWAAWERPEAGGRPWTFYPLRNAECAKAGRDRATLESSETPLLAHEAKRVSHTQEDGFLTKKKSIIELSYLKGATKNTAKDKDSQTACSTSTLDLDAMHIIDQATPSLKPGAGSQVQTGQANPEVRAGNCLSLVLHSSSNLLRTPIPPVPSEREEVPKGLKRVRSEGTTEPNTVASKKARLDLRTSSSPVATSTAQEPASRAVHSFLPSVLMGPAAFELSLYHKGPISWQRESDEFSIELYYQEGGRKVATVDGSLNIVIDPTELRGYTKEEIPESRGNFKLTLLPKNTADAPVQFVFDRTRGSKREIGKTQQRSFIYWLQRIVPTLSRLN